MPTKYKRRLVAQEIHRRDPQEVEDKLFDTTSGLVLPGLDHASCPEMRFHKRAALRLPRHEISAMRQAHVPRRIDSRLKIPPGPQLLGQGME